MSIEQLKDASLATTGTNQYPQRAYLFAVASSRSMYTPGAELGTETFAVLRLDKNGCVPHSCFNCLCSSFRMECFSLVRGLPDTVACNWPEYRSLKSTRTLSRGSSRHPNTSGRLPMAIPTLLQKSFSHLFLYLSRRDNYLLQTGGGIWGGCKFGPESDCLWHKWEGRELRQQSLERG
jgi:hypothetical protein